MIIVNYRQEAAGLRIPPQHLHTELQYRHLDLYHAAPVALFPCPGDHAQLRSAGHQLPLLGGNEYF